MWAYTKGTPGSTQRRLLREGLSAAMISRKVAPVLLLPGTEGRDHGTPEQCNVKRQGGPAICLPYPILMPGRLSSLAMTPDKNYFLMLRKELTLV